MLYVRNSYEYTVFQLQLQCQDDDNSCMVDVFIFQCVPQVIPPFEDIEKQIRYGINCLGVCLGV